MISVLEFIQNEVKSQHGTISKFIDDHFSRTSFYRLMNKPHKIKENDIVKICAALNLNKAKEQELRLVIKQSISGYSKNEYDEVLKLLYENPTFLKRRISEVEFFSSDESRNKTIKSYDNILERFSLEAGVRIKIKIRNCLSTPALSSVYSFISGLRKKIEEIKETKNVKIEIEHVLTVGSINSVSRIAILLNIAHMIQFCSYSVYFLEYNEDNLKEKDLSICNFLENTVSIREEHNDEKDNSKNKYFIFHLTNIDGKRDYCFETTDRHCYGFYRAIFNRLKFDASQKQSFFTVGASRVNEEIAKYKKPYRKLLMKSQPCLDNILPDIWKQLIIPLLKSDPNKLRIFRGIIDSDNNYAFLNDESFFYEQIKLLESRFNDNEHPGSINIYDVHGFEKFIETGVTTETKNHLPSLEIEHLKMQILYMIKHINSYYSDSNYQQFYFFKKSNATSNLFISIFDNKGICVLNEECMDLINSNFLYCDPDIAKLMYNVISNSLPSNEILSKEESLKFLKDKFFLIGGIESEITDCLLK